MLCAYGSGPLLDDLAENGNGFKFRATVPDLTSKRICIWTLQTQIECEWSRPGSSNWEEFRSKVKSPEATLPSAAHNGKVRSLQTLDQLIDELRGWRL